MPKKQWEELIPNLAQNTNNPSLEIRKAAILTLGDICEKLKNEKVYRLEINQIETILMGICFGLNKDECNPEIKQIALKALRDGMNFMESVFLKEEIRNFVFALLIDLCHS